MPRRKRLYEQLPLVPYMVADVVTTEVYTGQEISIQSRSQDQVNRTESLRQQMTPGQVEEFCRLCDAWCRAAYEARAEWFEVCIRKSKGREQLYVYIRHWLAAYLNDPEHFKLTAV